MSIWPNGSVAHWLMTFENGHKLPITKENAHWIIAAFQLKNLNPSGQYDENDNIVNTFEPLQEEKAAGLGKPTIKTCLNCRHWRDKSWTSKGWGICDNPANEVKAGPLAMIRYYLKDDPKAAEELAREVENGIRYPEDFGCIFFEAK